MLKTQNKLLFLRLALLFSVFGSGMTWTGLGYELASSYDNPGLMGLLQIISTSANLIGPLLIAFFPLKLKEKSILIQRFPLSISHNGCAIKKYSPATLDMGVS
jgi:hypothetical protein